MNIHHGLTREVDSGTLYAIFRLRSEVFVVEQNCVYLDLDGRDLEPLARQFWYTSPEGGVSATLRLLSEEEGCWRIGRVATAEPARGQGAAGELMTAALAWVGSATVVLNAQERLESWYERWGFRRDGEPFAEDGIPHVPMRRP